MNLYFKFIFLFFIGSTIGWVIELFFRRIVHGKWVNPGFLNGPYLPIYGFGLVILTFIYEMCNKISANPIIAIILMGMSMTLIELIGGLIALKNNVRLWDYRNNFGNYKGVICPLFSLIWTSIGAVYYFFIASHIINALIWFSNNLLFSYFLGIFTGLITIDLCYSSNTFAKIRKYAKENNITIMYENLKEHIKEFENKRKNLYSFVLPFKNPKELKNYIKDYQKKLNKKNILFFK